MIEVCSRKNDINLKKGEENVQQKQVNIGEELYTQLNYNEILKQSKLKYS